MSFALAVWSHRKTLVKYARKLTYQDSEDLVQEVVTRAIDKQHLFSGDYECDLRNWLVVIMHREWVNRLRHRIRSPVIEGIDFDKLAEVKSDQTVSADYRVYVREVVEMVEHLPRHKRDVLVGLVHGRSQQAIADELGIEVGTVRSRSSRARQDLRDQVRV
jgi:RNA polymerase sigma-70 factor, ECF subfamily